MDKARETYPKPAGGENGPDRGLAPRWRKAFVAAAALMVALRLVALDSDHYPRLTWSSALLTDEGFYIHNARNLVLYGRAVTDEWNNMLLMPMLHGLQVAFFFLFGVGAVQARLLSVGIGLLTLLVFFAALRRAFGVRVAVLATLFLGLDHVNLLYSRMAIMDPPAALALCAALYAFVRAAPGSETGETGVGWRRGWLSACGVCLGLGYATRGLAAIVLPVPFVVLWWAAPGGSRRERFAAVRPEAAWLLAGVGAVVAAYLVLWYVPYRAEIAGMNRFYLREQLLPGSLNHLRGNVVHAFIGDHRGMSPYLFRHTPVQFALVLAWLVWWRRAGLASLGPRGCEAARFVAAWLLVAWAFLAVVSYSPSRYYVLFYPALAALAALALARAGDVFRAVGQSVLARCALAGFFAFHLGLAVGHHRTFAADVMNYGLVAVAVALAWACGRHPLRFAPPSGVFRAVPAALVLWAAVNAAWTADWLGGLTYQRRDADRWLAANLPKGSVLFGAVAPGLCLDNDFQSVMMIKGLCNWKRPVERYAESPRYVVILGEEPGRPTRWRYRWKERYWTRHYPDIVARGNDIKVFPGMLRPMFYVRVYPVPDGKRYGGKDEGKIGVGAAQPDALGRL